MKDFESLHFDIMGKAQEAFKKMNDSEELKALGVEKVIVSETKRNLVTQMAYYSRGRMDVDDVKKMYAAAGLYSLSDAEARTKNTWTLQSKHIEGKAIDLVPVKNGRVWWTAPVEVWETMGAIGKSCGLKWGGDWKTKDSPHFEI